MPLKSNKLMSSSNVFMEHIILIATHFLLSFQMGMVSPLLAGPQQMTDTSGCVALPSYPGVEPSPSTHCGCSPHPQPAPLPCTQRLSGPGESDTPNRMPLPDIVQGANPYSVVELERYEPDMDSTDNPHYYNINKLLFNVHLERDHRRIGMPPS